VSPDGHRYGDTSLIFYGGLMQGIDAPRAVVLNVGAGPTPTTGRRLRGSVARLIGVDPDPIVLQNEDLDEAFVNDGVHLPFPDGYFDAAYSDWTVEHVHNPVPFLREIWRVLKPGASFWFRTNNLWHYATFASAITPNWLHRRVMPWIQSETFDRQEHDPWPTVYRMNTRKKVRSLLVDCGFSQPEIRMAEANPGAYLSFSPLLFLIGVAYERLVSNHKSLSGYRFTMCVRAAKPTSEMM